MMPYFLCPKDAADMLGISPSTLARWGKAGKITVHLENGQKRYRRHEVQRMLPRHVTAADVERIKAAIRRARARM